MDRNYRMISNDGEKQFPLTLKSVLAIYARAVTPRPPKNKQEMNEVATEMSRKARFYPRGISGSCPRARSQASRGISSPHLRASASEPQKRPLNSMNHARPEKSRNNSTMNGPCHATRLTSVSAA